MLRPKHSQKLCQPQDCLGRQNVHAAQVKTSWQGVGSGAPGGYGLKTEAAGRLV